MKFWRRKRAAPDVGFQSDVPDSGADREWDLRCFGHDFVCYALVPTDLEVLRATKEFFLGTWNERSPDDMGLKADPSFDFKNADEMLLAMVAGESESDVCFWSSEAPDCLLMLGVRFLEAGHMIVSLTLDATGELALQELERLRSFLRTDGGYITGGYFPPDDAEGFRDCSRRFEEDETWQTYGGGRAPSFLKKGGLSRLPPVRQCRLK